MDPVKIKGNRGNGPEKKIQEAIIKMLTLKGWYVKTTHGNMYQSGFPDLFACHAKFGTRWIEVKLPEMKGSKFTAAQLTDFAQMCANGSGVWVLTGDSEDEYKKLFLRCNWWSLLSAFK